MTPRSPVCSCACAGLCVCRHAWPLRARAITTSPQRLQAHFPQQIKCVPAPAERPAKLKSLMRCAACKTFFFICAATRPKQCP